MRLPKSLSLKIISSLILFFLAFFILVPCALAYIPAGGSYDEQFKSGLDSDSWEKGSFDFATVNNIMESISTSIIGTDDPDLNQKLGFNALGSVLNLTAYLYEIPPASSGQYFADLGERLKITKTAYAQGVGYSGLSSIKGLWTSFRNIAYLVITIVLVFIGFAIMFRFKINPQTVVGIQNALPKIIIALVLVTFSYAIAGLLIDLMYLVLSFMAAAIGQKILFQANVFGFVETFFGGFGFPGTSGAGETIGLAIKTLVSDLGYILPGIGSLAKLIISVTLLFTVFKIFFNLIVAYISIIAAVIFSPWMLMLEAIPGQKGLINWLKMMLTNIVPFIIVGVIFLIASALMGPVKEAGEGMWIAPFLGGGKGYAEAYIPTIIAFGLILATPSVIASVQKSLGTPGFAGMAAGVITPVTAAWGAIRGAGMEAYKLGRQGFQMTPYAKRKADIAKVESEAKGRYELEKAGKIDAQGKWKG